MNILIDPILVGLPRVEDGAEAFLDYVEHINLWKEEVVAHRHEFFVSELCLLALYDAGRYPLPRALDRIIGEIDTEVIGRDSVFRVCNAICENTPHFEDRFACRDILIDNTTVNVIPDLIARMDLQRPESAQVGIALKETLGYAAYVKEVECARDGTDLILLSYPMTGSTSVRVGALVLTGQGEEALVEETFASELTLVSTPEDLFTQMSIEDIWEDVSTSAAWAIDKLVRDQMIQRGRPVSRHVIMPTFVESIRKQGYQSRPGYLEKIYKALAQLLAHCGMALDTHTNHNLGNVNSVSEDNGGRRWIPRRIWATNDTENVRIHYWQLDTDIGRIYVIANVVPHEKFVIEGLPKNAHKYGK